MGIFLVPSCCLGGSPPPASPRRGPGPSLMTHRELTGRRGRWIPASAGMTPRLGRGPSNFPQMIALRLRQILVADFAERTTLAGLLDPGPHQSRIEIVAAVGIDRAGFDTGAEPCGRVEILGPQRGREPVGAVVHQRHRLV